MSNKVMTKWDDISKAGYPTAFWKDVFKKQHGKTPDQVHLNEGICVQYGHYCYNIQGTPTYRNRSAKKVLKVGAERVVENNSSEKSEYTVNLSTSMSRSCSVSVTNSSEFSFGNSISFGSKALGLSSEFSTQFTVKNEVGSESSTSIDVSLADTVTLEILPNSKKIVKLMVEWTALDEEFEIPFSIEGMVGANFKDRVDGHYYWFSGVTYGIGSTPTSTLIGKVTASYDIKGHVQVEDGDKSYHMKYAD